MDATIYCYMDQLDLRIQLDNPGGWVKRLLKYGLGDGYQVNKEVDQEGTIWWLLKKRNLDEVIDIFNEDGMGVLLIREYSTKVICNTKCKKAEEDDCVCSCGGKFHGHEDGSGWHNLVGDVLVKDDKQIVTRYFEKTS